MKVFRLNVSPGITSAPSTSSATTRMFVPLAGLVKSVVKLLISSLMPECLGLLGGEVGRHRTELRGDRPRRRLGEHGQQLLGELRRVDAGAVDRRDDA